MFGCLEGKSLSLCPIVQEKERGKAANVDHHGEFLLFTY